MNQYPDFDQKLYDDLRRGKEYAFAGQRIFLVGKLSFKRIA